MAATRRAITQKPRIGPSEARTRSKSPPGLSAALKAPAKPPRRKFHNIPTTVGGIKFDSKSEAARYASLLLLERAGEISGLEVQPKYRLEVNGQLIGTYRPDFRYVDTDTGLLVVEDVKSKPTITEAYRLRKKMMRAIYNIEVREVFK